MKNKLKISKLIIFLIYSLILIDIIAATVVYGLNCIHISVFFFVFFSAFTFVTMIKAQNDKGTCLAFEIISFFKLFASLAPEIFLDIFMNGYNFADDGIKFLPIFLYIVLVFVLFLSEAVYAGLSFASLKEQQEENTLT